MSGILIAAGAEELSEAIGSFVEDAQKRLPDAKDLGGLKDKFMETVTDQMEQLAAVSIWADARTRAALQVGDPPAPPRRTPSADRTSVGRTARTPSDPRA